MWFGNRGRGVRVDLIRHGSLCRMFLALVITAETGSTVDTNGLSAAGWHHEQVTLQSAHNQVRVNLAKLRELGLRELVLSANVATG